MRILAIDSSQRTASLAAMLQVERGANVMRAALLPADRRTAKSLIPALGQLLLDCGWTPSELELICVATGPGSFTGLRIGVTTAKTLAYATGAEVVGVNTLAAIAAGAGLASMPVWAILDAQRQELFASRFEVGWREGEFTQPQVEVLSIDVWLAQLQTGDGVCGPPLERLAHRLPRGVTVASADGWAPRAEIVGQLGIAAHARGEGVDPMRLSPNYFRRSAAEEKADQRSTG